MKSSTEIVYNKIKHKILTCEYQPAQLVSEKEIVDELQVSRTPVREALSMLNGQGLIDIIYNKGIQISNMSTRKVNEIYEIRRLLEPLAIKYAIKYIKPSDIDILLELDRKLEESIEEEDIISIFKYGMDVHIYIAQLAHNETLLNHIKILRDECYRSQVYYMKNYFSICSYENKLKVLDLIKVGHKELTIALRDKDEEKAIEFLLKDLNSVNDTIKNIDN